MRDLRMFPQAVDLDTIPVVDVGILLLRSSEELVVVKPSHIPNRLTKLSLTTQLAFPPVERRDVTLATSQQQLPSVASVLAQIRPKFLKLQLKALLGRQNSNSFANVVLANLVRPLKLRLGLEEPAGVLE